MIAILRLTFWLGLLMVLKKNGKQIITLFIWLVLFLLTDYFYEGFKGIEALSDHILITGFVIKVALQLTFLLMLLWSTHKLLKSKKIINGQEYSSPSLPKNLVTRKQRIINEYKKGIKK